MREITFSIQLPLGDRRHYVDEEDIRVVLERLPDAVKERVRGVHLNDRFGRSGTLGYTNRGRRDVALCALPPRASMSSALRGTGSTPEMFGALPGAQWPALALRRFVLYEVLLHEIGHLQVVRPDRRAERRRFAMEPRADSFARTWREELWAVPFAHSDPVHNPPSADEMAALSTWREAHTEYKLGIASSEQGDEDTAREHHTRAVALYPSHALALTELARSEPRIGRYDRGAFERTAALLRRAVEADPTLAQANFRLAWALLHLGEHAEARRHFERAQRHLQIGDTALAAYADALADEGLLADAERLLQRVLARSPSHAQALRYLARAIWDLAPISPENTARALAIFQKAVDAGPRDARAHEALGRALATIPAERSRAVHHLREALRIDPERSGVTELIREIEGEAAPV